MMSELARMAADRICGRCKYHRKGGWDEGKGWSIWQCMNEDSDCYLEETGYKDRCQDFEPRAEKRY